MLGIVLTSAQLKLTSRGRVAPLLHLPLEIVGETSGFGCGRTSTGFGFLVLMVVYSVKG